MWLDNIYYYYVKEKVLQNALGMLLKNLTLKDFVKIDKRTNY